MTMKQVRPLVLAAAAFFFFAFSTLIILLSSSKLNPLSAVDIQTFTRTTNIEIHLVEEKTASHRLSTEIISKHIPLNDVDILNGSSSSETDHISLSLATEKIKNEQILSSMNDDDEIQRENVTFSETKEAVGSISCDFSQPRSDTCTARGDVRILGASASIILARSSQANHRTPGEPPLKIKPFTRKWEQTTMARVTEFSIRASSDQAEIPQCTITHTVTAVVFSLGVFLNNYFHHFTDVLLPLFITSFHYAGEVQFFVTNYDEEWMKKYEVILKRLTRYQIVNLDRDSNTHCVEHLQVGMFSHSDLGVDPSRSPNNLTISDFRAFLRSCFGLKREAVRIGRRRRPRLLLIYRTGSRALVNRKEVVAMARSVGFKVVQAGPAATRDLAGFSRVVNSCDMVMGVHGAGLTNMLFLPEGAPVVQIVPWGALKETCNGDFGWPARGMGLKYYDYEIREEESTLIERYPKDHAVFTDPASIHRQGWNMLWLVFLTQQNIRLDVQRFRSTLEDAYRTLPRR